MTKLTVEAGICGFTATIEVVKLSPRRVSVSIASDCEMASALGSQLGELDWQDALRRPASSPVYNAAFEHIKHTACPLPVAVLKAIEVEVGAALPGDVTIRFETVNRHQPPPGKR